MSNRVGGSAVTKIGNTGRGTDGTGRGVGNADEGFDLGPAEFYVSREQPGRNTKWAFGLGGRGLRLGCVIREPLSTL